MSKSTRARTTTWRLPGNSSLRWLNRSSRTQALHRSYWSWYRKRPQRDVRSTGAPLVSSHSSSGCDESIGGNTHDDLETGSYLLPLATHGDACSPGETCLRGGVKRRWQGPPGRARGLMLIQTRRPTNLGDLGPSYSESLLPAATVLYTIRGGREMWH